MGRPIYSHELGDPDFAWLLSNFEENNPDYGIFSSPGLPIILISRPKEVEMEEGGFLGKSDPTEETAIPKEK